MEILWNVMDHENGVAVAKFFSDDDALLVLRHALETTSTNAYRQVDKQKRNEILLFVNRVVDEIPEVISTIGRVGMVPLICKLLSMQEFQSADNEFDPLLMTNGNDDFEFKRFLITLTKHLCTDSTNRAYFVDNGLLEFCNIYCKAETQNVGGPLIWNSLQLSTLQIQILGLVTDLIPASYKEFSNIDGPSVIIKLLESLIQQMEKIDPARVDLKRVHNSLFESCLLALTTLSERGPIFKKAMGSNRIFEHLLKILEFRQQSIQVWSKALIICSSLCQGCNSNKQLFGEAGGVPIVVSYLSYESSDPKEREMLVLAAVECIWGTICGNLTFEDLFIHSDGIKG